MRAFPKPLSAKEEKECLARCRAGDREAREELIKRNLRLVAYIAKKYNTGNKELEDLISIGTIGLIKGIDTFDENKNIRLATYAARCIDKAIQQDDDKIYALKGRQLRPHFLHNGLNQLVKVVPRPVHCRHSLAIS